MKRNAAGRLRPLVDVLEDRCVLSHSPLSALIGEIPKLQQTSVNGLHGDFSHRVSQPSLNTPHSLTYFEHEAGNAGTNNTPPHSEFITGFGTGDGDERAITIYGSLGATAVVTPHEDDGAIPLANSTGLIAGDDGAVEVHGVIGDGPHGSSGTAAGDYDFYQVSATEGQKITVDVEAFTHGSALNSAVGIMNSAGQLLTANVQGNPFLLSTDSLVSYVVPSTDDYYVVVFGALPQITDALFYQQILLPFSSGFSLNPFDSSSGVGVQSEGDYHMTISVQTPDAILQSAENNGSIPTAQATNLAAGNAEPVLVRGVIGDGPHGSAGTGKGDVDFFRVDAAAGQRIVVDVVTPIPLFNPFIADLDPMVGIYDQDGRLLDFNDDDFTSFESRLAFHVPNDGAYYIALGSSTYPDLLHFPDDPFDASTGVGVRSEGSYAMTVSLEDPADVDYFSFDLAGGDVIRANLDGSARLMELRAPDGTLLIRTAHSFDANEETRVFEGGGELIMPYVVNAPGRYSMALFDGSGDYELRLQLFRPGLSEEPVYAHQVVFVDFDGAVLDAEATFGRGHTEAVFRPLSDFLGNWGLAAGDEDAVIDAILESFAEIVAVDASGVLGRGNNGEFLITGWAGEMHIEILNSRDHEDPYGMYPNVARVVVGGTAQETGLPYIGIAQHLDVGNLVHDDTAVVLLGTLSAPAEVNPYSVNAVPLGPGVSIIDAIGARVGVVAAHELGHNLGNFHVYHLNDVSNVMDQLLTFHFLGPDGLFGTDDDVPLRYGVDRYAPFELFEGFEDALNTVAFGLSSGTQSGTYYDFVTGTLYATGDVNDGRRDHLMVTLNGTEIEIWINGALADSRALETVNAVVLNGSDDQDLLRVGGWIPGVAITLQGRGGQDVLLGGANDETLLGGAGNDVIFTGAGDDLVDGGPGDDVIISDFRDDLVTARNHRETLIDAALDDFIEIPGDRQIQRAPVDESRIVDDALDDQQLLAQRFAASPLRIDPPGDFHYTRTRHRQYASHRIVDGEQEIRPNS